ncbi:MAG: cell division protein FtsA [Bacillota bacterium]|nr:MAG: cell division protein FtsA [Bacillota bacterium]
MARRHQLREAVVGLDIGSTKVAVVVAEIASGQEPSIIGLGVAPNSGLRKGVVVDIEGTSRAILQAVEQAQRMSGVEITSAVVSVSGSHISSLNNRGVVAVSRPDHEITGEDVHRVLDAARVINLTPDREVLHIIPREFEVDGYDGVKDPVGMVGGRLEVEAHIVTAASASLQNLMRAVARAGLTVEGLWLSSLAAGEAVLTPAEKELGVVLVDIGGGTMDISIYDRGTPWYSGVIPIGGEHITSDIAVGLRVPLPLAEEIKVTRGVAATAMAGDGSFEVPNPSGRGSRQVPDKVLAGIIEPRVQEMVSLLAREIKRSAYPGILPGGVVFCGGTANLPGLTDLTADLLDLPVRVGQPGGLAGLNDIVAGPAFATAVGLVQLAGRSAAAAVAATGERSQPAGLWSRLRNWLEELF